MYETQYLFKGQFVFFQQCLYSLEMKQNSWTGANSVLVISCRYNYVIIDIFIHYWDEKPGVVKKSINLDRTVRAHFTACLRVMSSSIYTSSASFASKNDRKNRTLAGVTLEVFPLQHFDLQLQYPTQSFGWTFFEWKVSIQISFEARPLYFFPGKIMPLALMSHSIPK